MLGSCVRITLKAWMSVCVYSVCSILCVVYRGLATGWSPIQGVLLTVYRIYKLNKRPRPPLWSSGQSSWLQIRRSGVRFPALPEKKVVDLERCPLSLVSTTEEILDKKSSGSCLENREYGRKVPSRWRVTPLSAKSWQSLRRQAAVAQSV
jgi:hypothetical protein